MNFLRKLTRDVRICEERPFLGYVKRKLSEMQYARWMRARSKTDIFVISYPKSGRTWHRMLLGTYIARLTGDLKTAAADVERLTAESTGARTRYCHNFANFEDGLAADHPVVAKPELWEGRKALFIVREPKDVLVSAWFHARYRTRSYSGNIQEFIRSPLTGVQKLVAARNTWWNNRNRALAYMATSYEQMHADAAKVLRETLRFVGHWPIEEKFIEIAVQETRFEFMQRMESARVIEHGSLKPPSDDPKARKVRAGRVGGYREHLTVEDIAYIDEWTERIGDPFAELYAAPSVNRNPS